MKNYMGQDRPEVHLEVSNGRTLRLMPTDPYGFWVIRYDHGQLPPELADSHYTSESAARKAVSEYIARKGFETVSVKLTEQTDHSKTKKV